MPTPRSAGSGTRRRRPQGPSNSQVSVKRKRTAKDKAGGNGLQDSQDLKSPSLNNNVHENNHNSGDGTGSSQEGGTAAGGRRRGYEFLGMWRRGFPERITDPYRCGVCTIGFSDRAVRNEHEKLHSKPEGEKRAIFELHQKPRYPCPHCDNYYVTAGHRSDHVKREHPNCEPKVNQSNRKTLADFARPSVASISIPDSGP